MAIPSSQPLTGALRHPMGTFPPAPSTHHLPVLMPLLNSTRIKVTHWNIAGINNNPFEYWMDSTGTGDAATTAAEQAYTQLMMDAEAYITKQKKLSLADPKVVRVKSLLTPKMYNELSKLMEEKGWTGIEETKRYFDKCT